MCSGRPDRIDSRMIGRALALLSAVLVSSAAWAATPFDELIVPLEGKSACFTRMYDAKHLREHPKQKVTAMTVWLRYEAVGGSPPGVALGVSLGLTQRGDPDALYSDGGCNWDDRANRDTSNHKLIKAYPKEAGMVCLQSAQPDVFDATSAEEGGNFIMERGKDRDTLLVYLDDSLTMVQRATRGEHRFIEFGSDDRVFLLRRADPKDCAAVKDAVTTPEPGVAPRTR
jgi:hypothetical protein